MKVIALSFLVTLAVAAYFILAQSKETVNELKNPRIVIKKQARTLEVFEDDKLVKSMKLVLGFAPVGDKEVEGDGKTPEGEFYVFTKNSESRFHLSLGLSYPSKSDAERGLKANLISREEFDAINKAIDENGMPPQKTRLGGEIYIHGGGTDRDWTDGCIALRNEDITELFALIPKGAKVTIVS
jgi:murein L,D-transpeptidase YafK